MPDQIGAVIQPIAPAAPTAPITRPATTATRAFLLKKSNTPYIAISPDALLPPQSGPPDKVYKGLRALTIL